MPYFITVLALIFVGVGFTLFHQNEPTLGLTEETPDIETVDKAPLTTTIEPPKNNEPVTIVASAELTPSTEPTSVTPQAQIPAVTPSVQTPPPTPVVSNISSTYTDGTYSAQTSYRTPDGTYQMTVGVTLKQDEIMATTLSFDNEGAKDGYSKRFTNSYKSSLIGKDLENVSLSRVGGASLTTKAFNTALGSIRAQAS